MIRRMGDSGGDVVDLTSAREQVECEKSKEWLRSRLAEEFKDGGVNSGLYNERMVLYFGDIFKNITDKKDFNERILSALNRFARDLDIFISEYRGKPKDSEFLVPAPPTEILDRAKGLKAFLAKAIIDQSLLIADKKGGIPGKVLGTIKPKE